MKQRTAELLQIEHISKTSCSSDNENTKLQSPERNSRERSSNQESKRKKSQRGKEGGENAISGKQVDNVRMETHVVQVMTPCLETDAIRDKKDNRPLLHQKAKAQRDGKIPSKSSGRREECTRGRIPRQHVLRGKCTNPSCNFWHPPVCLNYKSESGCKHGDKCRLRHTEVDGQPSKKSKKSGVKGFSGFIEGVSIHLGCVAQDSYPRKYILREAGNLRSNHTVKFSKGTWHHMKKSGKKGSIARRHSEVITS